VNMDGPLPIPVNNTIDNSGQTSTDIWIACASMITMAIAPIYLGSLLSLQYNTVEGREDKETMSAKDAWGVPLFGSAMLFGLYILFKVFNKDLLNLVFTIYILFIGFFSLVKTFGPVLSLVLSAPSWGDKVFEIPPIPMATEKPQKVTKLNIVSGVFALAVVYGYAVSKHWILNNIFGLSFSIQGIGAFGLSNYKTGCILLGGLFFYDIFWVFGTDVMVTVAKGFDVPIKLLFPQCLFAAEYKFTMLGLGDIVIPGVFIALLLRYDYHRNATTKKGSNSTPYFHNTLIGYLLGLIITFYVANTWKLAQPALLYLVPTCIGSSFGTSILFGDVSDLFAYTEDKEEDKEAKEKTQ